VIRLVLLAGLALTIYIVVASGLGFIVGRAIRIADDATAAGRRRAR
jgi:hypothetical protein